MAHIDVSRFHSLGADGARRVAQEVVQDLRNEHGLRLQTRWEGDTLHASGRGFDARLEAGAEEIRVEASLGLLLRPLRGRITQEVHGYLDRYLDNGAS